MANRSLLENMAFQIAFFVLLAFMMCKASADVCSSYSAVDTDSYWLGEKIALCLYFLLHLKFLCLVSLFHFIGIPLVDAGAAPQWIIAASVCLHCNVSLASSLVLQMDHLARSGFLKSKFALVI